MGWRVYKHLVPTGTKQGHVPPETNALRAGALRADALRADALRADALQRSSFGAHRQVCNVYSLPQQTYSRPARGDMFAAAVVSCLLIAALMASWVPLQVSIVTVFLFAGPHNWFELRYFLLHLPARFGRSRHFFATAFAGLGLLTISYVSLPFLYQQANWSSETWLIVLASWNTLLLVWLIALIQLRSRQKRSRIIAAQRTADWAWTIPLALALASLNWLGPELFSLALVYVHPLIALWFLDRQLKRTRPDWVSTYRRCLCLLPLILTAMIWRLSLTASLADDNGLFWRITQHSGAQLLPQLSSHMLVSVHLFLEMLHYCVWIVALPLLTPRFLNGRNAKRGLPRLIPALLAAGIAVVVIMWVGFSRNYAQTRDVYFTIAIAHVLAEAPFLLKML